MELVKAFKINVRCLYLQLDGTVKRDLFKDLELTLDTTDAMRILFKFGPNMFNLSNGLQLIMRFDDTPENKLRAMFINDPVKMQDEDTEDTGRYIVAYPQLFWTEVLSAYDQIKTVEKIEILYSIPIADDEDEYDEKDKVQTVPC